MSTKIRIFLAILTVCLIATALTINKVVDEQHILEMDSKKLTDGIHDKEDQIDKIFADTLLQKIFANSERYPLQIREISKKYQEEFINLYIYKNNLPIFWSSNIYVPESIDGLRDNASYISIENRSFITKKQKINDEITVLALIAVKRFFSTTNQALQPAIVHRLVASKNLEIAEFGDNENIRNIYSKDKNYLFSVKLNKGPHNSIFVTIQLICWILATITMIILIQGFCLQIARKGHPWWSIAALIVTFFLVRLIDLESNWLSRNSSLNLFSTDNYSFGLLTPNLWSFIVNSLALVWIVCYCIYIKDLLVVKSKYTKGFLSIFTFYMLICIIYLSYYGVFTLISTLITHSPISNYNYLEILKTHPSAFYFVAIYCINICFLILLTDFILYLGYRISNRETHNINIQLFVLVQFLIIAAFFTELTFFNIFIGLIIMVRSYDKSIFTTKTISTRVITLISLAVMTSMTFSYGIRNTQEKHLLESIAHLKSNDDPEAMVLFDSIERDIMADEYLRNSLQFGLYNSNPELLQTYLKRKYVHGYLSKYDFQAYYYLNDNPMGPYSRDKIEEYREKVIHSTLLGSTNSFYKYPTDLGTLEYFAVISLPISLQDRATLILDFRNKAFSSPLPFPIVLSNNDRLQLQNRNVNSFAFYKNGVLVAQNGFHVYPNNNSSFPRELDTYITLDDDPTHLHVLYNPNPFHTIVASKKKQPYWEFIALASFSFLILYILMACVQMCWGMLPIFRSKQLSLSGLAYRFYKLKFSIQYSTRIQTLVITSVLFAVIISGVITLISVNYQSERNRQNEKLEYISHISNKIEGNILSGQDSIDNIQNIIRNISGVLTTDFNLYNSSGKLIYTSQPKIYDQRLISEYINMDALINLNVLKKSEILHTESVAEMRYDVTYATIRNADYQTIAYLSIPYFSSADENTTSQNILLNTILNIYTIIVILFAFLSVYISKKITDPLKFIGQKLAETSLSGKPTETLYWDRNDEIGTLIKEYNYMLVKLEENALQLRNKERETAWREMAQQVAHEIKNPLTPMKLGIQQLSRSFYENDPKLEERFKKISTSFIEQIDALSHIASEFSSFAKLPETKLIVIDLEEKIYKSIDTFANIPNTEIRFYNYTKRPKILVLGDKGQLLRSFNNLIKNAIEAGGKRRKLKITIEVFPLEDNWIEVRVHDNGLGIPEDVIHNIFRPNFTTKSSGTGLGLAFVKQTIEGMHGKIHFETQLNKGTTFFIALPLYLE